MRQELYCHACDRYVQFNEPEVDGRLVITCPNCGHEHYRVVRGGVITEDRWGSSNASLPTVWATSATTSATSYTSSSSSDYYLGNSWLNSSSVTSSSGSYST